VQAGFLSDQPGQRLEQLDGASEQLSTHRQRFRHRFVDVEQQLAGSIEKCSPAIVSSTRCVDLRNSSQPTNCSSARICRLSAGCEMYSRSAARPKLSSSATATNARR
jgi:hypothetical protein